MTIVNADDYGLNSETNLAIIDLLKSNRIYRTTIMVNMPYSQEAASLAKDNHLEDKVGLHINLTDGDPLSSSILSTRFCSNGQLMVRQVESGVRLYAKRKERLAIKEEVIAQFERFKDLFGYYPKHIDSHRHVHNYLGYLFTIIRIAKQYGVESMRIGINLYDYKQASIAKKAYKFLLNSIIKISFRHTDYMGAYLEYVNYFQGKEGDSVEIMVHPTYKEGKIFDIIYDENENKEFFPFEKIIF